MSIEGVKRYIFTIGYCIVYILCYILFLNRYAEYAGFTLYNTNIAFIVLSVLIAAFPIRFHKECKSVSSFISIFIYVLLYVPIILTFEMGSGLPQLQIFGIQIIFMFCMILLLCADKFVVKPAITLRFSTNKDVTILIFNTVLVIAILLTLYVMWVYRGNMRLVSFNEVYELRAKNAELGTGLFGYISSWLYTFFVPTCLVYGLMNKKKRFIVFSCVSCVIIYMATGSKGFVFFPVIIGGCYWLFKRVAFKHIYSKFVSVLSFALLILLIVPTFSHHVFDIKMRIMWRIIGNGGYITMWYYDYFSANPYTYYSHVNIINRITGGYPYDVPLGFVIGREYWSPLMNANANFWATDGIAATGMFGVVLVTLLFFCIFVFLNSITKKINPLFVLLLTIPFIYSILNLSLLTSLLTGGGFLLMFFFIILNSNNNITTNENSNDNRCETAIC